MKIKFLKNKQNIKEIAHEIHYYHINKNLLAFHVDIT